MADEQDKAKQQNADAIRVWESLRELAERKVGERDEAWRPLANALRALVGEPELETARAEQKAPAVIAGHAPAQPIARTGISRAPAVAVAAPPAPRTSGVHMTVKTTGPVVTTVGEATPAAKPAPAPAPPFRGPPTRR